MEFANRVGRCLTHLRHARLVERVRRGIYRLTAEGFDLQSRRPEKIGSALLRTYRPYREWLTAKQAQANFDVHDGVKGTLDRLGTDAAPDGHPESLPWTEAVSDVMDDGTMHFSINYDPEVGILPAFAEALIEYANCRSCGAPPQADFSACPCVKDKPSNAPRELRDWFDYWVDRNTWESRLEALRKKDRRRLYSRKSGAWRRRQERTRSSKEPSHTLGDIELLRDVQEAVCYFCDASIDEKRNVEHLDPLSRGGSDGFNNIVLACPSCNRDKYLSTERQYWGKLRKRLSPEEYQRRKARATAIKKEKQRRHPAGQLSSGRLKRKRLIFYR